MKLAKQQDDGKALMEEDEAWLQMLSDDEDDGPMCMMVDHEDEEFTYDDDDQDFSDQKSSGSESTSDVDSDSFSLFQEQINILSSKVSDYENNLLKERNLNASLESKLVNEHALVVKFNIELADAKDYINTLTLAKKRFRS